MTGAPPPGMAKRNAPGEESTDCVGAWGGDPDAHTKWAALEGLAGAAKALHPPDGSDSAVLELDDGSHRRGW